MNMKRLAEEIRVYRAKENLTQKELADLAEIATRTIYRLENNKARYIQDKTLEKLKELKIGLYINN